MKLKLQQVLRLAPLPGRMKASAHFQAPAVRLQTRNVAMPTLILEEAGVLMALEFTDTAAFEQFQCTLARLSISEESSDDS